jgi:hypothetical protein
MRTLLIVFFTYVAILNVTATYRLWRDESYDLFQKSVQTLLIWSLPFVGALLVSVMMNRAKIALRTPPPFWQRFIGALFFITYPVKKGFQSGMDNTFGPDIGTGGWDGYCDMNGGACDGGDG